MTDQVEVETPKSPNAPDNILLNEVFVASKPKKKINKALRSFNKRVTNLGQNISRTTGIVDRDFSDSEDEIDEKLPKMSDYFYGDDGELKYDSEFRIIHDSLVPGQESDDEKMFNNSGGANYVDQAEVEKERRIQRQELQLRNQAQQLQQQWATEQQNRRRQHPRHLSAPPEMHPYGIRHSPQPELYPSPDDDFNYLPQGYRHNYYNNNPRQSRHGAPKRTAGYTHQQQQPHRMQQLPPGTNSFSYMDDVYRQRLRQQEEEEIEMQNRQQWMRYIDVDNDQKVDEKKPLMVDHSTNVSHAPTPRALSPHKLPLTHTPGRASAGSISPLPEVSTPVSAKSGTRHLNTPPSPAGTSRTTPEHLEDKVSTASKSLSPPLPVDEDRSPSVASQKTPQPSQTPFVAPSLSQQPPDTGNKGFMMSFVDDSNQSKYSAKALFGKWKKNKAQDHPLNDPNLVVSSPGPQPQPQTQAQHVPQSMATGASPRPHSMAARPANSHPSVRASTVRPPSKSQSARPASSRPSRTSQRGAGSISPRKQRPATSPEQPAQPTQTEDPGVELYNYWLSARNYVGNFVGGFFTVNPEEVEKQQQHQQPTQQRSVSGNHKVTDEYEEDYSARSVMDVTPPSSPKMESKGSPRGPGDGGYDSDEETKAQRRFKKTMQFFFQKPVKEHSKLYAHGQVTPSLRHQSSFSSQRTHTIAPTIRSQPSNPDLKDGNNGNDNGIMHPVISQFVLMARQCARLSFVLRPLDAVIDAAPSLQNVVVVVELILLMWILYQVSIIIETVATAVKTLCMPVILISRILGITSGSPSSTK